MVTLIFLIAHIEMIAEVHSMEVGIALAVRTKSNCPPAQSFKGLSSCSSSTVFSVWGGTEGFLGGWGVNASQDLKAIEPLSHKVSLHARAQPLWLLLLH